MQKDSQVYQAARWAYQPVKITRQMLRELTVYPGRASKISKYLAKSGFKGMQIGSGPNLMAGWLNSDIAGFGSPADVFLDITRSLPIPADCFDAIYGSEVIEHIYVSHAERFFREALRVLVRGGVLRMTTPDVDEVCRITLGMNENSTIPMHATTWLEPDKELTSAVWINAMFRRWGHQHLWDFPSMEKSLLEAGFSKVKRVPAQVTNSRYAELANIDTRYGMPPPPHKWATSMIIEATK